MSVKQTVEDNIVVFLLGAMTAGFAAGWGAYAAVEHASGRTSISTDYLKQIEDHAKRLEDQAALKDDPKNDEMQRLESEGEALKRQLLQNRPSGQNYVTNISLSPTSPAVVKAPDHVVVSFDYMFAKEEKGYVYAEFESEPETHGQYEGSVLMQGSGRGSRYINLMSAGKITLINISMISESGEQLYSMQIPVKYLYK